MQIVEILDDNPFNNKKFLESFKKQIRLIEATEFPFSVVNEAITAGQVFNGAGEFSGFTWTSLNGSDSWEVRYPDGSTDRFAGVSENDLKRDARLFRRYGVNSRVASSGEVWKGSDGRYYVNYTTNTNTPGGRPDPGLARDDIAGFDNERDAERAHRRWTKNKTRTRSVRNWREFRAASKESRDANRAGLARRIYIQIDGWLKTLKWMGWLVQFFQAIGVTITTIDEIRGVMAELHVALAFGDITEEEYNEGKKYCLGWLLTQCTILFATAIAAGRIAKIIMWIRRFRMVAFAGGPIAGIIAFIVGTAAMWAIGWFLNKQSVQEAIIGAFISGIDDDIAEGWPVIMQTLIQAGLEGIAGAGAIITSQVSEPVMRNTTQSVANLVGNALPEVEAAQELARQYGDNPPQGYGLDPRADASLAVSGERNQPADPNATRVSPFD